MAKGKVLVAGASGVVGFAAAKEFARQGWDVVALARRPPQRLADRATLVALDLTDAEACRAATAGLADVTHVVYAALFEKPGLVPGWFEHDQMERNQLMLANLLDPLTESARGLAHVTLLQGTKAYGAHVEPMRLPGREREPRHRHENFYWLQEDYLRAKAAAGSWAFTILRPQIIFGEAFGSNMNAIPAFGVYAATQRLRGEPLHFPGGKGTFLTEAVDADLLGRAICWAATAPAAVNETFNVTNGDLFIMRNYWGALADAFGMQAGPDRPLCLAAEMPGRQGEWAEVHRRFGLRSPVDLTEFVGQSFIYADLITGYGRDEAGGVTTLSTIKLRQAGFGDCIDTEDMFRKWVAHFQQERFFPPRAW